VSKVKPAQVSYYLDADILGLARVLAGLRPDVTFPGDRGHVINKRQRPPCPITDVATKDSVWIPQVTQRGWLIITRDRHVKDHRREIGAVVEYGSRMVVLSGQEARTTWEQLEIVMGQWRRIERCRDESGPFIYLATRTQLRQVELKGSEGLRAG
jgi:PIN like domain